MDENELALYRRKNVGFIFQSFNLVSSMAALDNVSFPLWFPGLRRSSAKNAAKRCSISGVEQPGHCTSPSELSGGQQQRVAIARALINNPPLILADEPTGNLDTSSGLGIMQMLSDLHRSGRTVVVVTHDLRMPHFSTHVLHLLDGKVVSESEYTAASSMMNQVSAFRGKTNIMKKKIASILLIASLTFFMLMTWQLPLVSAETTEAPSAELLAAIYAVTLDPSSVSKSGAIGTTITYTLTLKNTGDTSDTFLLTCSGTWAATCQYDIGPVEAGQTSKFPVKVAIPASAASGAIDTTTVTLTSAGDAGISATATLTTTAAFARPLVIVSSYSVNDGAITPGQDFTINLTLVNSGNSPAANLVLAFESTDFLPRETGGVNAVSSLGAGSSVQISQAMTSSADLAGKTLGTLAGKLSYTDPVGNAYTEAFTFTINLKQPVYYNSGPSATPTTTLRPQLVISQYKVNVDPLQPGSTFNLDIEIHNLGNADARAVTMVIGGTVSPDVSGTPSPGGISGGGSELTNFAPLGSSNLLYIGDIAAGAGQTISSQLIVNVTTQPGAYTLKLSFVYNDSKGNRQVDDQVITLLVYSLPQVEVSYYRDPGIMMTGQPNILPLQVTNLGRKSVVLGNMKITAENADLTNNITLIGPLDPGGYFTLDSQLMPFTAGTVTLNYHDQLHG